MKYHLSNIFDKLRFHAMRHRAIGKIRLLERSVAFDR